MCQHSQHTSQAEDGLHLSILLIAVEAQDFQLPACCGCVSILPSPFGRSCLLLWLSKQASHDIASGCLRSSAFAPHCKAAPKRSACAKYRGDALLTKVADAEPH